MVRHLFASLTVCLLSWSAFAETKYAIVGSAYNVNNLNELLYTEHYTVASTEGQTEVHYLSPQNERFAEKQLDYRRGDTRPDFALTDRRHDLHWGAKWNGDQLLLKRGSPTDPDTRLIKTKGDQVVDAGFVALIQEQWHSLLKGEKAEFHFAFPNRLTNIRLHAEMISMADSPIEKKHEDWRYFRVQLANSLMSAFVDNLYLAYEPEGKHLMVFRGRSNLLSNDGDRWDVEIHYRHH